MTRWNEGRVLVTRATHALRLGRREEAEALVRRALEAAPRDPEVLGTSAEIAWSLGDAATTVTLLEQALAQAETPVPLEWRLRLAEALVTAGRLDEAVGAYQDAVAASSEEVRGWGGLARVLQALGDVPGAVHAWKEAIRLAPDDWEAHNDLGAALFESRDWDGAEAAFAAATASAPENELAVVINRATLAVRRGKPEAAVALMEPRVARQADVSAAHAALGFALREQGRFPEAADVLRRALALEPGNPSFACGLARALLEAGDAAGSLVVARDYLRRRPGYAGALAAEALAHLALGDGAAARRLLDHDRFVSRIELGVPDEFADIAAFNAALSLHAAAHRSLLPSPASHATQSGFHSGSLLVSPRGPVAAFERALRAAVADYWRALSGLADSDLAGHPFVTSRPSAARFNMWCVVMPPGGHQTPHIHPAAWLSGVYYPQLPEAVRTGDGPEGWLEFGFAERPFPSRLEPEIVRVRPAEGLLVLFPSYFYHRTIPFSAEGTRISIAFDLVPAQALP